jgi:GNAT superfamily N-acetyltransferase
MLQSMASTLIAPYDDRYQRGILELILPIQQREFDVAVTIDDQPDLQNISTYYQKGNGNFWVELARETVVGTLGLRDIGNNQAALRKLFVHQEYRGKTSGTALETVRQTFRVG